MGFNYNVYISLDTLVPNSRDRQGKLCVIFAITRIKYTNSIANTLVTTLVTRKAYSIYTVQNLTKE